MSRHTSPRHTSRGQATPLWAIVLVLAALLLVPLALLARATIERSDAQNAADAVALAGALDGEDEARAIASMNGARIESYDASGDAVEVTVVIGGRRATARAVRDVVRVDPTARIGGADPDRRGVDTLDP